MRLPGYVGAVRDNTDSMWLKWPPISRPEHIDYRAAANTVPAPAVVSSVVRLARSQR